MLTCYLTRRRLGAWLDGALDGRASGATAAHVAICGRCQREAEDLRRLRGLLRSHLAPAEPDWTGFWPGIVRRIDAARLHPAPAPAPVRAWRPRWAFGGALAAALLLTLGLWEWMPRPDGAPGVPGSETGVVVSSARTDDPRGTVMVYSTPEQDVAVVWVFGLD